MKYLKDFHLEIRPETPGAPFALVNRAIINAAIEFCDRTLTWRKCVDAQGVRAGQSTYDLDVPSTARVAHVMYVGHDGVRVGPINEHNLDTDSDLEGWRDTDNQSDTAEGFYLPDRKTIRLVLTPATTVAGGLEVFCALKPRVDVTQLPDVLYDDHLEAIGNGAKARLLSMSKVPWADMTMAGVYSDLFDQAKRKERAERLNDYTRESDLTIRPPNYFAG